PCLDASGRSVTRLCQLRADSASAAERDRGRSASGLKQLDRIAGAVLEHDLLPTRSRHDVAADAYVGRAQPFQLGIEIVDLDHEPVPAARRGPTAIRHRTRGGA